MESGDRLYQQEWKQQNKKRLCRTHSFAIALLHSKDGFS